MTSRSKTLALLALCTAILAPTGCDRGGASTDQPGGKGDDSSANALKVVLEGSHRSAENKARDVYRHPAETLAFFGVKPTSTVVELWPGGGWYTEILAPYLKDGGKLIVTSPDPNGDAESPYVAAAKRFAEKFSDTSKFGTLTTVIVGNEPFSLGGPGSVDVVLTFRNSHGWYAGNRQEEIYGAAFAVLKSGGTFGVVQHRAPEGGDAKAWAEKGYLPESVVIEAATKVGFVLDAKSEINANPKDTRDYPEGVWSLPPTLEKAGDNAERYKAIGESDRMTLRFKKP